MTVRVSLPAPLGQRNVYFNGDTIFLASHGKLILQCAALNGAGCGIPSTPVPASCTDPSFQQAMGETAPPMHADSSDLQRGTALLDVTVPGYSWEADVSPAAFHAGLRSRCISSGGAIPIARIPATIRRA